MFIVLDFRGKCKEFIVLVIIDGKSVDMEFDIGVFVIIIFKSIWIDVFASKFVERIDVRLRSYLGYVILVIGEVKV